MKEVLTDEMITMFKEGITVSKIAIIFNVDRKKVSRELKNMGYVVKHNKFNTERLTDSDYEDMVEMYNAGESLRSIGRKKAISHNQVSEILRRRGVIKDVILWDEVKIYNMHFKDMKRWSQIRDELGIPLREIKKIFANNNWTARHSGRIRIFNQNKFSVIDSHEKSYWLGFLYGDGYINEQEWNLEIALKKEDEYHLEKFIHFIEGENLELKRRTIKLGEKEHEAIRLIINSKILILDLIKLGCFQKKSLTVIFPNEDQVPREFMSSFIAGYFDANGSVTVNPERRSYIFSYSSGNEAFLINIGKIINENTGLPEPSVYKKEDSDYSFSISYTKKNSLTQFYKWCFSDLDKHIPMTRKQERFKKLFFKQEII